MLQVRSLQQENSKLSKEIHKWETYQNQEINNVKYVYDQEIVSLKEALDGLSRQYAVLEDAIRYFSFDIAAFCSKLC